MKNLKGKIKYRVLSEFRFKNVFTTTTKCNFENEIGCEDLHTTQLVEKIVEKYLHIRLFSYAKFYEQVVKRGKIGARQQSNKLVLFKGL